MITRKINESPIPQGEDERISYILDTSPWGGYDSGAAVVLKNTDGEDISDTNLSGLIAVDGNEITTPLVIKLEHAIKYRLEFLWVKDGNTLETYCEILGEI